MMFSGIIQLKVDDLYFDADERRFIIISHPAKILNIAESLKPFCEQGIISGILQ